MGTLVVAGCDESLVLELGEQVLELVALAVEGLVVVGRDFAATAGWDARLYAWGFQFRAEPGAVVASVGDEMRDWRQGVKHETGALVAAHLAFRQKQDDPRADLREEIDAINARIYQALNNGVYRAGFANTQVAYEEAFHDVFAMLDELQGRLDDGRDFLLRDRLPEADVRLFVTLVRFDVAYHGLFKCNRRRIADYPGLSAYQARILALPGVRKTVSVDHIKRGYYSIKALNPTGIFPVGPEVPAALAS